MNADDDMVISDDSDLGKIGTFRLRCPITAKKSLGSSEPSSQRSSLILSLQAAHSVAVRYPSTGTVYDSGVQPYVVTRPSDLG